MLRTCDGNDEDDERDRPRLLAKQHNPPKRNKNERSVKVLKFRKNMPKPAICDGNRPIQKRQASPCYSTDWYADAFAVKPTNAMQPLP
jgi:hypothetical protein